MQKRLREPAPDRKATRAVFFLFCFVDTEHKNRSFFLEVPLGKRYKARSLIPLTNLLSTVSTPRSDWFAMREWAESCSPPLGSFIRTGANMADVLFLQSCSLLSIVFAFPTEACNCWEVEPRKGWRVDSTCWPGCCVLGQGT